MPFRSHPRLTAALLSLFLCLLLSAAVLAESAPELPDGSAPVVDLDLTALSGTPLLDRLSEIRANPADWQGQTLRVRGKYYGHSDDSGLRHSLIVCDTCQLAEIGITMLPAEDADIIFPENNVVVEITARVEPFETAYGTVISRLVVFFLTSPA